MDRERVAVVSDDVKHGTVADCAELDHFTVDRVALSGRNVSATCNVAVTVELHPRPRLFSVYKLAVGGKIHERKQDRTR